MADFSPRIFARSFRYAAKGLRYAFRHEQSFRVQLAIALLVVILALALGLTRGEALILTVVISSVFVLELLNTVLERFIDLLKPRLHFVVEIVKDLMAAAVFVASVGAAIVGLLIFLPKVL